MAEMPGDSTASYREMGDDELLALAADGRSSFEPKAWQAIETELAARSLSGDRHSSSLGVSPSRS